MLGQIELGQSAPTINVLWKIASGLGVTFSALITAQQRSGPLVLRAQQARLLTSSDRKFSSRALFPVDEPRRVEFYELRLSPGGVEHADAHAAGTVENLVVAAGRGRDRGRRRAPRARRGRRHHVRGRQPARLPQPRARRGGDVPRHDLRRHRRLNPPLRSDLQAWKIGRWAGSRLRSLPVWAPGSARTLAALA